MAHSRTFKNEVDLEEFLNEDEYNFFKINKNNFLSYSSVIPLLQENIKIVNNGRREYLSGFKKDGIFLVINQQGEILGELSTQTSMSVVESYSYDSEEFGKTFHKVLGPVAKETKKEPNSNKNKRKVTIDIEKASIPDGPRKEAKAAAPIIDLTAEEKPAAPMPVPMGFRDPYICLTEAMILYNKGLSQLAITGNPFYMQMNQLTLQSIAILIKESHRTKSRELETFKQMTQGRSSDPTVLLHIHSLQQKIEDLANLDQKISPEQLQFAVTEDSLVLFSFAEVNGRLSIAPLQIAAAPPMSSVSPPSSISTPPSVPSLPSPPSSRTYTSSQSQTLFQPAVGQSDPGLSVIAGGVEEETEHSPPENPVSTEEDEVARYLL